MSKVVAKAKGLQRERGFLYYIDKQGDVSRVPRAVGHYPGPTGAKEKVLQMGLKKEPGMWYCLRGCDVLAISPKKGRN
jgi:uncharacterized protein YcgL (UPF0745 family)